jgi:hypothetical protein
MSLRKTHPHSASQHAMDSGGERRGVSQSEFAQQLSERLRFPGDRRRRKIDA